MPVCCSSVKQALERVENMSPSIDVVADVQ